MDGETIGFLARLMLYFSLFSILGYIIEVILCSIGQKKMVGRGFLFGPYLPIYGFGGVLILLCTEKTQGNFALTFLISMGVCSALEYVTSFLLEKIFHLRWWDYSRSDKLNLNGRICARNSLAFGIGGCILVYSALPLVDRIINLLPEDWRLVVALILAVIFLLDTIASSYVTGKLKNVEEIGKIIGDQTNEIKRHAKKALKQLFKKPAVKAKK